MNQETITFLSEPSLSGKGSRDQYLLQARARSHAKTRASRPAPRRPGGYVKDPARPVTLPSKRGPANSTKVTSLPSQNDSSKQDVDAGQEPGPPRTNSSRECIQHSIMHEPSLAKTIRPSISAYIETMYQGSPASHVSRLFEYCMLHKHPCLRRSC